MTGRVSVIIPSRHERWLQQTIDDVLLHAAGDVEVLAVLDGCDQPVRDDPRVRVIATPERIGMRDAITVGVEAAAGEWIMKTDGHCSFGDGYDEILKADCDDDWIVVPRRMSLDVETWTRKENGKAPIDQHYLSWPWLRPGDVTCGLHGNTWPERARKRLDILIDPDQSSQGSCWFMKKVYYRPENSSFIGSSFHNEMQWLGLRCQLSGGQLVCSKKTHYFHLHKGDPRRGGYGTGYQFKNAEWKKWAEQAARAKARTVRYWLGNEWPERKYDFRHIVEQFWPMPGWPDDWEKQAHDFISSGAWC